MVPFWGSHSHARIHNHKVPRLLAVRVERQIVNHREINHPAHRRLRHAFHEMLHALRVVDKRAVAHDVLRHRVGLSYEAEAENISSEQIINTILNKVDVP